MSDKFKTRILRVTDINFQDNVRFELNFVTAVLWFHFEYQKRRVYIKNYLNLSLELTLCIINN